MNRQPIPRLALTLRNALIALSVPLAAFAGAADQTAKPPAESELGGAAGPAPTGAASTAGPSASAADSSENREAEGLLRLGATLTQRADYPTAEIAFWQVLHRPEFGLPAQKTALLGLAHMYRKESKDDSLTKAAAIYERFVKDYPNDERIPDALLELGRTQRDLGAYHRAISQFYSVINSTLKFPTQGLEHYEALAKTAQFEIAQTHFEAGEFEEAGKFFSKVRLLDLAPADRAHAHFMAAVSLQKAADYNGAVATFRAYLSQYPDDQNAPEARYLLATSLRQLKRPQEALAVTLDLLRDEHGRDSTDARRWAYWQRRTGNQVANEFFQNGDTFNALSIYKGLNQLSPDPAWRLPVTYQIALCYERLNQLDDARAAYGSIIAAAKTNPGNPAPSADLTELVQMATWRLSHLDWRDNTDRQFNLFFTNSALPTPAAVPKAPSHPPHPS